MVNLVEDHRGIGGSEEGVSRGLDGLATRANLLKAALLGSGADGSDPLVDLLDVLVQGGLLGSSLVGSAHLGEATAASHLGALGVTCAVLRHRVREGGEVEGAVERGGGGKVRIEVTGFLPVFPRPHQWQCLATAERKRRPPRASAKSL